MELYFFLSDRPVLIVLKSSMQNSWVQSLLFYTSAVICYIFACVKGFTGHQHKPKTHATIRRAAQVDVASLQLPQPKGYDICVLDKNDINEASVLAFDGFFEYTLPNKPDTNFIIRGFNAIERWDAWLTNYIGFRTRVGRRAVSTYRIGHIASMYSRESILVGAVITPKQKKKLHEDGVFFPDSSIRNKQSSPDGKLVGVIELSLEPANGHLASMTVRDLVGTGRDTHDMKPYLCNLCVDTAYRRQGIGQFLCKVCEKIAIQHWKRSDMYLHVIERLLVCMKTWAIEDLRWRHGWMEKYVMTFYTFTRF